MRRILLALFLLALPAVAQRLTPEQRTAKHFEAIRNRPDQLLLFLRAMPKGGDLHNHLSGSVYAESYIDYAAADGACVDRKTLTLTPPPCDAQQGQPPASMAYQDSALYQQMLDQFSIRNWTTASGIPQSQRFFDAFGKFDLVAGRHRGEMLAEVVSRAGREGVIYMELTTSLDHGDAAALGARVGWDADLVRLRDKLVAAGLRELVAEKRKQLDRTEQQAREMMRCGASQADPGCAVAVRHIAEVHRGLPPQLVFAEMLFGFELARQDPRVVSVNPVMAEMLYVSRRDFMLHMSMIEYLHGIYPQVPLTLHAGEIAPHLAPPEALRGFIRWSIEKGHARRIGHGTDALYEDDPTGLMQEMAKRGVMVEVCPTSFQVLLKEYGIVHPFPQYWKHGVPMAIGTDDIGVSRSNTTTEFVRGVGEFGLSYGQLKTMLRNSLEYAFIDGASLWSDGRTWRRAAACGGDRPGRPVASACRKLLDASEKARLQWKLEEQLAGFEARF